MRSASGLEPSPATSMRGDELRLPADKRDVLHSARSISVSPSRRLHDTVLAALLPPPCPRRSSLRRSRIVPTAAAVSQRRRSRSASCEFTGVLTQVPPGACSRDSGLQPFLSIRAHTRGRLPHTDDDGIGTLTMALPEARRRFCFLHLRCPLLITSPRPFCHRGNRLDVAQPSLRITAPQQASNCALLGAVSAAY